MPLVNASSLLLWADQIGESDCEIITDGILGQPANALSSLAYTLFGLWLIGRAARNRTSEMGIEIVYGAALASMGIGSFLFHGPMPPGSRLLHDLTIAAALAVIVGRNLGALRGWSKAWSLGTTAIITAIVGMIMAVAPDPGNILTGVVGAGAIGTEVMLYRRGERRFSRRVAWILGTAVVLLVGAGIINVLGRTGGPICDPDSLLQGHALWHLMTAAVFMLYGYTAFPADSDAKAARTTA